MIKRFEQKEILSPSTPFPLNNSLLLGKHTRHESFLCKVFVAPCTRYSDSLYENFTYLILDTGDLKLLLMQSISVHVSWDTGDLKFLFMQSISVHMSLDTGNLKFLLMQSK